MTIALLIAAVIAGGPVLARVARPPTLVGPPAYPVSAACPLTITTPGGRGGGSPIPVRGLELGALVERSDLAFPTGGSGNAITAWEERRRQAGLQYQPKVFDPDARDRPSVFAPDATDAPAPPVYQRLLLKPSAVVDLSYGLIFARAVNVTDGRIVSLGLTLPRKPATKPKITIGRARIRSAHCSEFQSIDIYAPDMSIRQLLRLSTSSSCNWFDLAGCNFAGSPRGNVLFVQQERSGRGYEHRWVDYDNLERGRSGVIVSGGGGRASTISSKGAGS